MCIRDSSRVSFLPSTNIDDPLTFDVDVFGGKLIYVLDWCLFLVVLRSSEVISGVYMPFLKLAYSTVLLCLLNLGGYGGDETLKGPLVFSFKLLSSLYIPCLKLAYLGIC